MKENQDFLVLLLLLLLTPHEMYIKNLDKSQSSPAAPALFPENNMGKNVNRETERLTTAAPRKCLLHILTVLITVDQKTFKTLYFYFIMKKSCFET